jgi:ubiquinol-cytochrome c reductase cytochrome b subunit
MRRHGVSGPVKRPAGTAFPFFPYQAARDVTVALIVAVVLVALSWRGMPALEAPADPSDATYTPRPEWYFLGLFQLLKYFPGRWEIVGAIVLPGLALAALALLPWIDRGPDRDPRRRRAVLGAVSAAAAIIVALTAAGWRDTGRDATATGVWTPRQIAGSVLIAGAGCDRCHGETAMADAVGTSPLTRPSGWLASHIVDPEMIGPGLRPPPRVNPRDVDALVAYVARLSRGDAPPEVADGTRAAALIFARHCVGCHRLDGDGGGQGDDDGPELSRIGAKQNVLTLRRWIADPESIDPDATMPAFENKLTPGELEAIAAYLASRR